MTALNLFPSFPIPTFLRRFAYLWGGSRRTIAAATPTQARAAIKQLHHTTPAIVPVRRSTQTPSTAPWTYQLGSGPHLGTLHRVHAPTKSEARAKIKAQHGLKTTRGIVVERLERRSPMLRLAA